MATKLHLLYQITKYVFGRLHVTAPPVALNRCALRLAGHQSPRQGGCAGWDRLAESLAESGGIRGLVRVVLAGMNPQGEDLLKLLGGMEPP